MATLVRSPWVGAVELRLEVAAELPKRLVGVVQLYSLLPVTTHLLPLPLYNPIPHESSDLTRQLLLFCEPLRVHATTSVSTKFTWQDTELDYFSLINVRYS